MKEVAKEDLEGVPEAFLLYNVLTLSECEQFIKIIDQVGAKPPGAVKGMKSIHCLLICFVNSSYEDTISECKFWKASLEVTMPIWDRVSKFIPTTCESNEDNKKWELVRSSPLNEKFRFYTCMRSSSCHKYNIYLYYLFR